VGLSLVGYDGAQNVRDEERPMAAETGPSPTADSEERSRRVLGWVLIVAALVLAGVIGMIVYGYLARPRWTGVADKTLWDWLQLLSALAIPVVLAPPPFSKPSTYVVPSLCTATRSGSHRKNSSRKSPGLLSSTRRLIRSAWTSESKCRPATLTL